MPSSTTTTEYGVRYLNGEEDWNTRSWFGHIESVEMRESFQEQYNLRMKQFGMPPMKVTFLTRTSTTTISDAVVIDDSVPPAAEPPAEQPPAEEESTVEDPNT